MSRAYWPFYCEENIWQLCREPQFVGADARVLFISNAARQFAMWGQRLAEPGAPVVWDYHVVLLARQTELESNSWAIWDLDGVEPSPRSASAWLSASFDLVGSLPPIYEPRFRMLSAGDYQRHFRSDRRHMRSADGFMHEPPPWPPILGDASEGSNLDAFVDMIETTDLSGPDLSGPQSFGQLFSLSELRRWLETERPGHA